jgi:hypothetical protein
MEEEYSFPPYVERMKEALKAFDGEAMDSYEGRDVTPLRDLKGEGLTWSFTHLYRAPKLEKIVFAAYNHKDKRRSFLAMIWPDDEHALPVYSSYWGESAKGSFFIIDLYPLADCICDIAYMEHYLEPLEGMYSKGLKHFPGLSGRSVNWFRALASPYLLSGDLFPSTKESQDKIMELTFEYLRIYTELWKKDEPRPKEYMRALNIRKEAIRTNFREKDPGTRMLLRSVGQELTELSLAALF